MALSCALYLSRPPPHLSLSLYFFLIWEREEGKSFPPGAREGREAAYFSQDQKGWKGRGIRLWALRGAFFFLDECEKWARSTSDPHFRYTPFSYGVSQERNLMAS